jgi:U4/U6.U5 tri-snRNP-associated protein 2
MTKFDGTTFIEEIDPSRNGVVIKKKYEITKLPKNLVIHIKRFSKNEFFLEKNPTIVNFPIKNLDLTELVQLKEGQK